jgi:alcohol dehydrogenase (cytochrome c)
MLYIPAMTGCVKIEIEPNRRNGLIFSGGRWTTDEHFESNLTAIDPITFEIKKSVHLPYPNYSGILSTGGGLVFLALYDGTIAAFDDTTLEQLWKINVGSGFSAPPMTYEFNGRQYVAIASGASNIVIRVMRQSLQLPELREMRQATVLYVFGL